MQLNQFEEHIKSYVPFRLTNDQEKLLHVLHDFLSYDIGKKTFVLKGYAGTGKTTMVSALVKALGKWNYTSMLLAPTGRAAKVLTGYSKRRAFTIHKMIYSTRRVSGRMQFVLKNNTFKRTIFIIDEASMIGNQAGINGKSLLEDVMSYVYNGEKCHIIFVGDTAQLPPVHEDVSKALDPMFLTKAYYTNVFTYELEEVVRQEEDSGILFNATSIRKDIKRGEGIPKLNDSIGNDVFKITGETLQEELEDAYSRNLEGAIVVCRSNKRANLFNQQIRARVLFKEEEIEGGDLMMVVKNNYAWLPGDSKAGFIANGDIIEIKAIRRIEEIYGFRFATALVKLIDYPDELPFETKLFMEAIDIEQTSLPRAKLKELYYAIEEDYLEDYPYKKDRIEMILKDPYFNALQVKFAYAVTCHKSQGGQWDTVFIDQGYLTKEMIDTNYLRWLYTAITRAKEKLYLVNFHQDFFQK